MIQNCFENTKPSKSVLGAKEKYLKSWKINMSKTLREPTQKLEIHLNISINFHIKLVKNKI